MQLRLSYTYVLLFSLIVVGCSASPVTTPVSTVTNTVAPPSTPTSPVSMDTPLPSPSPAPVESCVAEDVLDSIQNEIWFDEFEIHYNDLGGAQSLVFWYTEPEISLDVELSDIENNLSIAIQSGVLVSQYLAQEYPCLSELFPYLNPVVVDQNYNGWFSGRVATTDLLGDKKSIDEIVGVFEIGYLREAPPDEFAAEEANICSWPDTEERVAWHFPKDETNTVFYYVIDDAGVNVWSQWVIKREFDVIENLGPYVLNIVMELDCLYPAPTQVIMIVVDEAGITRFVGLIPGAAVQKMGDGEYGEVLSMVQVLYQE